MFPLLRIYFKGKIQYKLHEKKEFIEALVITKNLETICMEVNNRMIVK